MGAWFEMVVGLGWIAAVAAIALATFVGLVLLLYLVGPLLVRATVRLREDQPVRPLGKNALPLASIAAKKRVGPSLEELGFMPTADLFSREPAFDLTITIHVYEQAEAGRSAAILVPFPHAGSSGPLGDDGRPLDREAKAGPWTLDFCTLYGDGAELDTTLSSNPSVLLTSGRKRSLQVDHLEPPDLYRLHLIREARREREDAAFGDALVRHLPDADDPATSINTQLLHEYAEMRAIGYLRRDPADPRANKLTLPAAYRTTWRTLWPLKPILLARARRRADAMLADADSPPSDRTPAVRRGSPIAMT